jgi:dephospho-CoA kinase
MQVGITGGIGAGKSLICRIFKILGIPVYDADSRAKQLMQESAELRQKIIDTFGTQSYDAKGKLNRPYLAKLVFSDGQKVQELNALVHPEVAKDFSLWADSREHKFPYIIKEAALLIESGSYKQLDFLVAVLAPEDLRIERTLKRDPYRDRYQIKSIISKQIDDDQRIKIADAVLYNDEQQPLIQQILGLHQRLVQ